MSGQRIVPRMARQVLEGCVRCLDTSEVPIGAWYPADPDGGAVCDRCEQRDDAGGYARLLAWRRMSCPMRHAA